MNSHWVLFWSTILKTWSKCLWTCTKFLPLSVFILKGWSLLQMKLFSCMINLLVERSPTNSICFALVVKQLSFVPYCFGVVWDALYLYLPSQSEDKSNQSWYCCSLNIVLVGYSSLEIKISLFVFYSNSIISELYLSTVFSLVSTQSLVTTSRCVLFHNDSPFYDDE